MFGHGVDLIAKQGQSATGGTESGNDGGDEEDDDDDNDAVAVDLDEVTR